ncbi:MSMEG_0565 family glycosyltransferase [Paenibacillus polysaccharolyticus]|uniref:MSMEG_0565 family glycosyltransferase n=1 Tax=Paenibacillus polysaccharolyticus TaxID=582692 RepID=UPI00209E1523|nr:MSMEG_0565 family glycosyltransferase [Paenibacillus polysaccharolyticus]MCP1136234.1 MSMEG_0565 family glycosyltransferase [Paenibacillus polysaccharolyticus]
MKVALYTYNTKPRGGVVHTLALAEALRAKGCSVIVFALGLNRTTQFFRPVSADTKVFPFAHRENEAFEDRILRYIDTYIAGLENEDLHQFDIHHAQDCISANCLNRLSKKGLVPFFLRTVHHLDDFVTPTLVECQHQSVTQPKALITVSHTWKERLEHSYSRTSTVIYNGVEERYFQHGQSLEEIKTSLGLHDKIVFLTLGGIEPRKNTIATLQAFAEVKHRLPQAVLLIAGGATLFDYRDYRVQYDRIVEGLPSLVREDIRILSAPDNQMVQLLYQLADVYVQPSVQEGWGLAVLEAMASGAPVVASNIAVFQEYLTHEHNALLADPFDPAELAAHMLRVVRDTELQIRLSKNGIYTASEYTWPMAADRHIHLYRGMLTDGRTGKSGEAYC